MNANRPTTDTKLPSDGANISHHQYNHEMDAAHSVDAISIGNSNRRNHHSRDHDQELLDAFAKLQLPRMETTSSSTTTVIPSLRFLVLADIDLTSASALAEYALRQQSSQSQSSSHRHSQSQALDKVDCILACGPLVNEDDLYTKYYQGRRRRRQRPRHQGQHVRLERSREETAALQGLASSALSQLENIVCRVIYLPSKEQSSQSQSMQNDTTHQDEHLRLTSNSINVQKQWLPLVPGLGVVGFAADNINNNDGNQHHHNNENHNATMTTTSFFWDEEEHGDKDDRIDYDNDNDEHKRRQRRTRRRNNQQQQNVEMLKQLLQLAPPSNTQNDNDNDDENVVVFSLPTCQNILLLPTRFDEEATISDTRKEEDYDVSNEYDNDIDNSTYTNKDVAFEEEKWPPGHLLEFLTLPDTLQQVVFTVAPVAAVAATTSTQPLATATTMTAPLDGRNSSDDKTCIAFPPVISPGSLSRHGDFCLVDIGLHPISTESDDDDETTRTTTTTATTTSPNRACQESKQKQQECQARHSKRRVRCSYRWQVDCVQHDNIFKNNNT